VYRALSRAQMTSVESAMKPVIAGVAMTPFGKFAGRTVRSLAEEATAAALADAGLPRKAVQRIFFSNATSGVLTGQECVRAQAALRHSDFAGVPMINVENACASGSTAVHLAQLAVASGQADAVLVVGVEKLTSDDKLASLKAFETALDQEELPALRASFGAGGPRSVFMDVYAGLAKEYMSKTGASQADFAAVAVKSHASGALNPKAQYRDAVTLEEVLAAREVVYPLTLHMCSPLGDGAAALVICTPELARRLGKPNVQIAASALVSGSGDTDLPSAASRASKLAYEMAALGPQDIHVVELHDATAPAELILYEDLGLCGHGEAAALLHSGATAIGGRCPVGPSGGLLSKGHPVGASGVAQIVELVEQLRGHSGQRQRAGAKTALAENGGGFIGRDVAACGVTILSV
jgi:acetyl-CoA acyltransferase